MSDWIILAGKSWQTAAEKAAPGDTLIAAAGDHGKQVLTVDKALVFEAQIGTTVQLLDLQGAGRLSFHDFRCKRHFVQGASHDLLFDYCDFGGTPDVPAMNAQSQVKKYDQASSEQPSGIVYENCNFHDVRRSDKTVHTEGLQIMNGAGVEFHGCRFWNCDGTGDLGVTPLSVIDGLLIEDCVVDGGGDTGYGIQFGGKIKDLVCRRNSGNAPGGVFFSDREVVIAPADAGPNYIFEQNTWIEGYSLRHSDAAQSKQADGSPNCVFSDAPAPPPPPPPPTDLELARQAEMEFAAMWDCVQRATSTYAYWQKKQAAGGYKDVTTTWWWKAKQHKDAGFEALGRIGA